MWLTWCICTYHIITAVIRKENSTEFRFFVSSGLWSPKPEACWTVGSWIGIVWEDPSLTKHSAWPGLKPRFFLSWVKHSTYWAVTLYLDSGRQRGIWASESSLNGYILYNGSLPLGLNKDLRNDVKLSDQGSVYNIYSSGVGDDSWSIRQWVDHRHQNSCPLSPKRLIVLVEVFLQFRLIPALK